MMRRSVVVLTLPFPVQPGSGRKRGVEEPYVEHITTVHSKDFMQTTEKFDGTTRRGELYTTKSRDESVVMDTYITQDGGRIDWLRQQWPPAVLHVKEASKTCG
ncbi:hypothetical protein DIPPA_25103 [Diplonema papillatum]|nr:hypothetical protein DIPPA_25103 [Diplonema papillatum]